MTNLNIPNAVTNGTVADATDIQQNFDAIESHVNTEVINRDGSVAMTGELLLPSNPTSNLAASTKSYVDGKDSAMDTRVAALEGKDFTVTFGTGSDLSGSFTVTDLGSVTNTTVAVRDDSHTHDTRYFTETEADARFLGITAKAADSDKLDNLDSGSFLRSDADDSASGTLTLTGNVYVGAVGKYLVIKDSVSGTQQITFATEDLSASRTVTFPNATGTVALTSSNITGSAAKLTTARTISLGGDCSGSASFDGSANITITATVADDSHAHVISNVDGLQTALDGKQASGNYLGSTNRGRTITGCSLTGNSYTGASLILQSNGTGDADTQAGVSIAFFHYWAGSSYAPQFRAAGNYIYLRDGAGNDNSIFNVNTVQYRTISNTSSRTLKENIVDYDGATAVIDQLRPVTFNYIEGDGSTKIGLIAEEVQEVLPLAAVDVDGTVGLDVGTLLGLALAGLQEANARISVLEAQVAALQG